MLLFQNQNQNQVNHCYKPTSKHQLTGNTKAGREGTKTSTSINSTRRHNQKSNGEVQSKELRECVQRDVKERVELLAGRFESSKGVLYSEQLGHLVQGTIVPAGQQRLGGLRKIVTSNRLKASASSEC